MKKILTKTFLITLIFCLASFPLISNKMLLSGEIPKEDIGLIFLLFLFFGFILSMLLYVLEEKRAYENCIVGEIKRINGLYRLSIINSSKMVFGFLSRSKGILQNPESVLHVGSANEQIASFLLREDCTREFISSSILGLKSALRPSKYDDLLKIFSGVADSLNYPIKCKHFPTFELVGGKMSDTYYEEKTLVTFHVDFFFKQLKEIERCMYFYRSRLGEEIQRLETFENDSEKKEIQCLEVLENNSEEKEK